MAAPQGNVEIDLSNGGYGGDFSYDPTGDLNLAIDVVGTVNVPATIERLSRLINTNSLTEDELGNVIAEPDDLFHIKYGSSIRAEIGELFDETFVANVTGKIIAALFTDAGVAKSPAPTVEITNGGNGIAYIDVSVWLTTGQQITLPTIPLRVS